MKPIGPVARRIRYALAHLLQLLWALGWGAQPADLRLRAAEVLAAGWGSHELRLPRWRRRLRKLEGRFITRN